MVGRKESGQSEVELGILSHWPFASTATLGISGCKSHVGEEQEMRA